MNMTASHIIWSNGWKYPDGTLLACLFACDYTNSWEYAINILKIYNGIARSILNVRDSGYTHTNNQDLLEILQESIGSGNEILVPQTVWEIKKLIEPPHVVNKSKKRKPDEKSKITRTEYFSYKDTDDNGREIFAKYKPIKESDSDLRILFENVWLQLVFDTNKEILNILEQEI